MFVPLLDITPTAGIVATLLYTEASTFEATPLAPPVKYTGFPTTKTGSPLLYTCIILPPKVSPLIIAGSL